MLDTESSWIENLNEQTLMILNFIEKKKNNGFWKNAKAQKFLFG